ncbi:MAG: hypothetical protein PWQ57_999 [Desulfovibrionales bacterium]|nr:hypothetical protein [Desulfovibrionales bacterium]
MRTLIATLGAVLLLAGVVWAQQQAPEQPLNLAYFPKKAVEFTHTPHLKEAGLQCEECHHKKVDGKIVKCSTSGCHDVFDRKDRSEASFYNMVHGRGSKDMQSCLGCHKEAAKGKFKSMGRELTSCKGSVCHP